MRKFSRSVLWQSFWTVIKFLGHWFRTVSMIWDNANLNSLNIQSFFFQGICMVNAESGADTSKKVTLDNQTTSYGIFQVRPWFNLKSSFHPNTVVILFDYRSTAKIGVARDAKVASATKTAKVSPVWVHNFEDPIRRCRRVLRSPADHFREQHNISVINWCFFIFSLPLWRAAFLTDDISDDIECAKQIHKDQGFSYWKGWVNKCKQKPLPDISMCWNWDRSKASGATWKLRVVECKCLGQILLSWSMDEINKVEIWNIQCSIKSHLTVSQSSFW